MKKIKIVNREVEVCLCDGCGAELDNAYSAYRCFLCDKDVCGECASLTNLYDNSISPSFYVDYRHFICEPCLEIGRDILIKIIENRNKAAKEDAILFKLWRDTVGSVYKGINEAKEGKTVRVSL